MKYLLDTCFVSELIRKEPNPGVLNWLADKNESSLYLSVLTIGEIKKGISRLQDQKKKRDLELWLIELENRFEERIVPIDTDVARKWGQVQGELELTGHSMPSIDALIACTALVHNLIVVTHNGKDMKKSKIEIIDPWI